MPDSLPVALNDGRLHEIDVGETFATTRSFAVNLENHGEAVHVHLHLDDTLSRVAELAAGNHYVEANGTESVRVEVRDVDETVTGRLKIVTGYGAETAIVEMTIEPTVVEKSPVEVDETLAQPQTAERSDPPWAPLRDQWTQNPPNSTLLLVFVLAILAVLLALVVGLMVDSAPVLVGVGIVIGGAVAALLLLAR